MPGKPVRFGADFRVPSIVMTGRQGPQWNPQWWTPKPRETKRLDKSRPRRASPAGPALNLDENDAADAADCVPKGTPAVVNVTEVAANTRFSIRLVA